MMAIKCQYCISDISEIRTVVDDVISHVESERNITDAQHYQIKLVMNELINNCFKHAAPDTANPVEVDVLMDSEQLDMTIKDNGDGFDAKSRLLASTEPEESALFSPNGRGLLLAAKMASELLFNEKGNLAHVRIDL